VKRLVLLRVGTFLFLFWLFWPRAWMPRATQAQLDELGSAGGPLLEAPPRVPGQAVILLLAPDEDAFPAARVLRSAGVPFGVSRDVSALSGRRLAVVPLAEKMPRLNDADRRALKRFVTEGGTLFIQTTGLLPWPELTALQSVSPKRTRRLLLFRRQADPALEVLPPALRRISLSDASVSKGPWTAGLNPAGHLADALAVFPDTRDAALTRRRLGAGRVFVLGADLRDLFVRLQAGRAFDAPAPGRSFTASADAWPLLLGALYQSATPGWVRLRPLPDGATALLLLSHSIETGVSVAAAESWAAREAGRGVRSTWFVQTNDSDAGVPGPFYDASFAAAVGRIAARGHEIAAHTVDLPDGFESLPWGTGIETSRSYRPQTVDGKLWDASLMGEVRVPKELLERRPPGSSVAGFRGPAFSYPDALDSALAGSGYAYDASLAASDVRTRRPFLLTRRRGMTGESGIVELPATFGGGDPRLPAPTAEEVLAALHRAAAVGGVVAWESTPREAAAGPEEAVLAALPPGTSVQTFGEAARFWGARSRTRFRLEPGPGPDDATLRLELPPDADRAGLAFETERPILSCQSQTPDLRAYCLGRRILLTGTGGDPEGALALQFEAPPSTAPARTATPARSRASASRRGTRSARGARRSSRARRRRRPGTTRASKRRHSARRSGRAGRASRRRTRPTKSRAGRTASARRSPPARAADAPPKASSAPRN
jgi:hypothetical protein